MKVRFALATLFTLTITMSLFANAWSAVSPQIPLAGSAISQFVDPLPNLDIVSAGTVQIELRMKEFKSMVLPTNVVPGYTGTWVWGYLQPGQANEQLNNGTVPGRQSYIGPVIVATRNVPTESSS